MLSVLTRSSTRSTSCPPALTALWNAIQKVLAWPTRIQRVLQRLCDGQICRGWERDTYSVRERRRRNLDNEMSFKGMKLEVRTNRGLNTVETGPGWKVEYLLHTYRNLTDRLLQPRRPSFIPTVITVHVSRWSWCQSSNVRNMTNEPYFSRSASLWIKISIRSAITSRNCLQHRLVFRMTSSAKDFSFTWRVQKGT